MYDSNRMLAGASGRGHLTHGLHEYALPSIALMIKLSIHYFFAILAYGKCPAGYFRDNGCTTLKLEITYTAVENHRRIGHINPEWGVTILP